MTIERNLTNNMDKRIITLTSDFGDTFAQSQLETVIHGINPNIRFIVASNEVTPFSIIEGAFIISKFYPLTPKGSIHIGVIDPGVGSERKGIIIKTENYWFVGPDNGIFYPATIQDGIEETFLIDYEKLGGFSITFHGRDVFAKVAAYISLGKPLEDFAYSEKKFQIQKFHFQKHQVVHIDPYGDIKLSSQPNGFTLGDKLQIKLSNKKSIIATYCKTFSDVDPGEFLTYYGSHQTLEIACNLHSAKKLLGVAVGDIVQIEKVLDREKLI